jgi:hypothetical protein
VRVTLGGLRRLHVDAIEDEDVVLVRHQRIEDRPRRERRRVPGAEIVAGHGAVRREENAESLRESGVLRASLRRYEALEQRERERRAGRGPEQRPAGNGRLEMD